MNILRKHQVLSILRNIDFALAKSKEADRTNLLPGYDSNATFALKQAREQLLDASVGDVEIDAVEPMILAVA